MPLTHDHIRRIVQVAHAQDMGFVELVGLAELDPAEAFKGATLHGLDLRGEDLSGFDFTGARMEGCQLDGADLSRAAGIDAAVLNGATGLKTARLPFWVSGRPPSWADTWGRDEYGPWVSFKVPGTEVTQRMRWCPPGKFLMGSPEEEEGRFDNEGPQHEVTIGQGFWMFETVCTEALWTAVMGSPPGRPRGPAFPATDVSWMESQDFAARLNVKLPGLEVALPSEACWEYACRAGTQTPYSFGEKISRDQVCFDSQAPVEVGSLPANRWGLREMHGNIWEWCEDAWHKNYRDAPPDASARAESGSLAVRVVRGGGWLNDARYVRAAFRNGNDPSDRNHNLGFRLALGQRQSDRTQAAPVALA